MGSAHIWLAALALAVGCRIEGAEYHELPEQVLYLKSANSDHAGTLSDLFGTSIALSEDGSTLAIGAIGEDGSATTVNDPYDNDAAEAGAVYVFVREDDKWRQEAYVKPENGEAGDRFGYDVALSSDGSTLVASTTDERSDGSSPANNTVEQAGAAYVFRRIDGRWQQVSYLKHDHPSERDLFGTSVAMSGDGTTVVVGAPHDDGASQGVTPGSPPGDEGAETAGAVFVFEERAGSWVQTAFIKPLKNEADNRFGYTVALSLDGQTLVVGAPSEDGGGRGVDPDPAPNEQNSGSAFVFERTESSWAETAYLKATNTQTGDYFGSAVAISRAGSRIVVTAPNEDGNGSGPDDNSLESAGAAYVYDRAGQTWAVRGYLKAPNPDVNDTFGADAVACSGDGNLIVVGARNEAGGSTGIVEASDPRLDDDTRPNAGAVYVFRVAETVEPYYYVKASNTYENDGFGGSVAMSDDGTTLVSGSPNESNAGQGIDPPQQQRATGAFFGAAYVFR